MHKLVSIITSILIRFDQKKIEKIKAYNQQLVLSKNQRIVAYAVKAMYDQLISRIDIDSIAAYGIIWKAVIEFHEKEGIDYVHGDELGVDERIRRTRETHRLIEKYLIEALDNPEDDSEKIKQIMEEVFEEYKLNIAYRGK